MSIEQPFQPRSTPPSPEESPVEVAPEVTLHEARSITKKERDAGEFTFEKEGNVNAEMVLQQSALYFGYMNQSATSALVALLEAEDSNLLSPEARNHLYKTLDRIYQQVAQLRPLHMELIALGTDLSLLGVSLTSEQVQEKLQQLKEQERVTDSRHLKF